jgi:formylglycine-generating enzyme required for sulfatase activity
MTAKSCCTPTRERPEVISSPSIRVDAGQLLPRVSTRMVELPGGQFLMGTDYGHAFPQDGEGPVRSVMLSPLSVDQYPVTNECFAEFIHATGYVTEAERFGWSFVFWLHLPKNHSPALVQGRDPTAPWWYGVKGAMWNAPEGPGSHINARQDHPVVHVSWNDAQAFCRWSGRRLPSEAEWEYAARGGLEQKLYPWGDQLRVGGVHRCNIWQGDFPNVDIAEDGYAGTCPVVAFPPNGFNLYSMVGNTWEWCADWFSPDFHRTASTINPKGPPEGTARVMKGGSFLCHRSYCNRYRVAARSSNTPDSSCSNLGFRCVL